ncbi:MAG TPA: DUF4340 domain-containing protein [Sandaracinaceae bacterium LLY-WYZ-13_1]|nr:DUF4340 domain-containing protein [Sandaracinaceae bacterium LLY-WYZ-13_1]
MSKKVTIVLAVLNAALLGYILLVERGSLSTSEVAGRSGHVLRRFVRERVDRVTLERSDEPALVFVRERDEDADELDLGTWRIAAPIEANADDDAVDGFLSALEWLMAERTLQDVTAEDRTRFGLDDPRLAVRFTVGDEEVELRVGGEAPTGEGVYASVEGTGRVYVVGEDFVESIDHGVGFFRDKDLFFEFYAGDADAIRLEGDGLVYRFAQEDGVWRVREPVAGWANRGLVDRLLRLTRELEAARFVADEPSGLAEYGLEAPWRELVVSRPADAEGAREARLAVGEACSEHEDERYARVGDGPVVCVAAADVAALSFEADAVRERRLLAVSDDRVESVRVEAGERRLALRRTESGWELEADGETAAADDAAISAWLGALRDQRAERFEPVEGEAPGHGLGEPRATVTVRRTDDEGQEVLRLGEATDQGAWVRRGDEAAVARFGASAAELLTPAAIRFRDRALVGAAPGEARAITVRSGGTEERAVRGEGGAWRLEAPLSTEADRVVVRDVARQIAELHAARFVAAQPAPEHGLAEPSRVVTVRFEPQEGDARTVTLRIGAETVEGAYGRLGEDGPVFELESAVVEALERRLVSRDLLTVPTEDLSALRIERGEETVSLERAEGRWRRTDGGEADPDRTRELLDRLGTLRASGVMRYGEPDGTLGLTPPAVRVVATRRESAEGPRTVTLELGAEQGEGDRAAVPARRSDLAVIFRFRPELVRILREYR